MSEIELFYNLVLDRKWWYYPNQIHDKTIWQEHTTDSDALLFCFLIRFQRSLSLYNVIRCTILIQLNLYRTLVTCHLLDESLYLGMLYDFKIFDNLTKLWLMKGKQHFWN